MKHESFSGQRLAIVQPLGVDAAADGPPLVVVDGLGSRKGDLVMVTSDGTFARQVTNHTNTPARWSVVGIVD